MYHIHTTEGIILKRTNFGEANVLIYVLTKDFGLIFASAQSARSHKSKLSSALVEYSHLTLSMVKGKNGWKITNAIAKENLFFDYGEFAKIIIAKISGVLIKMIAGEERHPEIFDVVIEGFKSLKILEEKNILSFESLLMLRILYHLGYIASNDNIKIYLENNSFTDDLLEKIYTDKNEVISLINKGLKESQL